MDKILTEAFDKLKAIEESEDPFCIGELSENEEDVAEEEEIVEEVVEEDEEQLDEEHFADEDKSYEVEDDSGNHYGLYFQGAARGDPQAFVEANGISVAHFAVGGAGPMDVRIQKPQLLLDALVAFAMQGK